MAGDRAVGALEQRFLGGDRSRKELSRAETGDPMEQGVHAIEILRIRIDPVAHERRYRWARAAGHYAAVTNTGGIGGAGVEQIASRGRELEDQRLILRNALQKSDDLLPSFFREVFQQVGIELVGERVAQTDQVVETSEHAAQSDGRAQW